MHDSEQYNNSSNNNTRHRSTKLYGSPSASPSRISPYTKAYPHAAQRQPAFTRPSNNGSTWQQLVMGASSAAGTTAAVVSEESMKCMKYCLSWLQYAIQHIEQQMGLIRTFLVSLATSQSSSQVPSSSLAVPQSGSSASVLSTVKKDVVDTLRKVVDIISKYAGSSLPYHAKVTVRGFILSLPGRWASLNDIRSTATSPVGSPILSASSSTTTIRTFRSLDGKEDMELPKHEDTAIRLLNFGQESVDMLQSISTVFSDTVDRADLWLDRLRLRPPEEKRDDQQVQLPPIHTLDPNLHHASFGDSNLHHLPYTPSEYIVRQQKMDLTH